MATLTLIDGGAQQVYEAHPLGVARKALLSAAEIEGLPLSSTMRRMAAALPDRGRTITTDLPPADGEPPAGAEHPIEVARMALFAAAELEDKAGRYGYAGTMWTFADSLPDRGRRDRKRKPATDEWAPWREAKAAWRDLPAERRQGLLLNALGGDRLPIGELTERMNTELGYPPESRYVALSPDEARRTAMRMLDGQLDRVLESFRNKPRYRWFRKRDDGVA
jgi:hypothetical protein